MNKWAVIAILTGLFLWSRSKGAFATVTGAVGGGPSSAQRTALFRGTPGAPGVDAPMFLGSAPITSAYPEGLVTKASISPTLSYANYPQGEVVVNITVVDPATNTATGMSFGWDAEALALAPVNLAYLESIPEAERTDVNWAQIAAVKAVLGVS